jgi:hypothetical protein
MHAWLGWWCVVGGSRCDLVPLFSAERDPRKANSIPKTTRTSGHEDVVLVVSLGAILWTARD